MSSVMLPQLAHCSRNYNPGKAGAVLRKTQSSPPTPYQVILGFVLREFTSKEILEIGR